MKNLNEVITPSGMSVAQVRAKMAQLHARRAELINQDLTQQEVDIREECKGSLLAFCQHAWFILEPGREMSVAWPLEAMCEHLEAVSRGEIKRLLINVPPGSMKSLLTRVFWPAWEWGPNGEPGIRYCSASFNDKLSIRDARRMRELILNPWYQKLWPNVSLSKDQSEKANFENLSRGFMRTFTVTGTTGIRGDRVIIDDPHDVMQSDSETVRSETVRWFRESVPSRLNDFDESAIVVIMQRVHEDDVSGHIITNNANYVHLCIPLYYEQDRHCATSIGWEDPRTKEGENFWPDRYTQRYIDEVTADGNMGEYAISSQFQQRPSPRGGGIIKQEWFQLWEELEYPPFEFIVAYLDTAYTEKQENDYSAMVVLGVFRDKNNLPKIMVIYAWHERLELNPLVNKCAKICKKFKVDKLLIEDKAAGHSVAQELRRLFGAEEFSIQLDNPKGQDKVARTYSVQHLFSEKMIFAPDKEWADVLIAQMTAFPKAKHDDLHDSTVGALKWLRNSGWALRKEENDYAMARDFAPQGTDKPLYDV